MFNLTRYYAIASLACILVAATILGAFYRYLSIETLMRMAEDRNAAVTRVFGNALWPHFGPLLRAPSEARPDPAKVALIREEVVALMKETFVVKVKIYNMEGTTVFSTDPKQMGQSKRDNAGFKGAAEGRLMSELTHRDQFSAFDRVLEDRDVLSSYIPFRREAGERIDGVFELYYDITPLLADVERTQWLVFFVVTGVLTLLYALLYLIVRRAQRIIGQQAADLRTYLAHIEEAKQQLDERVHERTHELKEVNDALKAEILERERAEVRLQLAAKVFESTVEGVMITDASTRIMAVNRAFTVVTGYDEAEVIGSTPRFLQSSRHDREFYEAMWRELQQSGQWIGEVWNRRRSGEIYPERLTIGTVRDQEGRIAHYVGVFSDISDVKRTQERLDFLAHHDLLTGLPNRLLFNDRVTHAIERAQRDGRAIAILFVDLDRFKHVNDTLGHEFGDQLLKRVADQLTATLRNSDTIARLGGDEFIVLLEDIADRDGAMAVARQLLTILAQPISVASNEVFVSASIGVSCYPADGQEVTTLIRNADAAMYHAKTHGRNACFPYELSMSDQARERVRFEALLRRSIERAELTLVYQPQVDLATGALVGVEALARWHNPELGWVPPARFIPVAEDIGFVSALGEWVVREACAQVKRWDAQGFAVPRVAVNLSPRQLEHGNVVDTVDGALRETGLAAHRLEMEVTESALMQGGHAVARLHELRALGVELAVDDFGTGYCSLSYLPQLPLQKLKIDRSFVTGAATDPGREAIVRAVIALAKALRLRVIAEGIETVEDAEFLRAERCTEGQGYLYSRPLAPDALLAIWGKAPRAVIEAAELSEA